MEKNKEILKRLEDDQQLDIIYDLIYQKYSSSIKQIKKYAENNNLTLQECIQEVNDKKSKLSRMQRDLLIMFKPEILKILFNYQ